MIHEYDIMKTFFEHDATKRDTVIEPSDNTLEEMRPSQQIRLLKKDIGQLQRKNEDLKKQILIMEETLGATQEQLMKKSTVTTNSKESLCVFDDLLR